MPVKRIPEVVSLLFSVNELFQLRPLFVMPVSAEIAFSFSFPGYITLKCNAGLYVRDGRRRRSWADAANDVNIFTSSAKPSISLKETAPLGCEPALLYNS